MNTAFGDYDPYSDSAMEGRPEKPYGGEVDRSHGEDRISYRDAVGRLAAFVSSQKGGMEMPHISRESSNLYIDETESYWQLGRCDGSAVCVVRRSGVRLLTETL